MPERAFWTPLRPNQIFVRLQLPFLVGVTVASIATVLAVPELSHSPLLWAGLSALAIASGVFLLPSKHWMTTAWVVVIPMLDVICIAGVRTALLAYLPTVGMLCLLPFAWIAYRFRWPGLTAVLVSGALIAALPFALGVRPATTLLAIVNVLALPFIATGISLAIHLGARSFEKRRAIAEEATAALRGALNESNETQLLLRSVLDTVTGAVAYYNARDELILANSTAEKMVDIVGFRLDIPPFAGPDVLAADRKTPISLDQQIIPRALRGEVIASHMEWLGRPGNQIAIMASSRRVHREDGTLLGTVIVAYDVTELANAIEVREEFLTTVSHELRTPLTSIIGYTEEIVDVLGERAQHLGIDAWLATIERNADTLMKRVNDLLHVADAELVLERQQTDVDVIVRRAVEQFTVVAERTGIVLDTRVETGLLADVDPRRFGQAVENLVGNALKFTARGGTVTVRAHRQESDTICVSVADTGIGMTPDEQRRIFDRFYRAQAVRENALQGIGVGLSIVKTIVDAHGGKITVVSAPGAGTTVRIDVPMNPAVATSHAHAVAITPH